jgi:hypothetical protein
VIPFQQDTRYKFTFTHADQRSRDYKPSPLLASKKTCKSADLQLDLSLQSNIQSSSRTGI